MIPRDVIDTSAVPAPAGDFEQELSQFPVPYIAQQTNSWCWAACTQMVVASHQARYPSQCALANMAFGRADCCNNPLPGLCDQGYNNLCQLFVTMQFNCRTQATPLTPVEIQNQVQRGPIIYNILWAGGHQHTGVISNIRPLGGQNYQVYFLDPDLAFFNAWGHAAQGWVDYAWVLNGYGFPGNWTTTWYDIEQ